jgi:hypothetical protein
MKKLANIALTALIATTAIVGTARGAQAGGPCYAATVVMNMERDILGGATAQQAFNWAVEEGLATDSTRCITRLRGYSQQVRSIAPYTHYAFN